MTEAPRPGATPPEISGLQKEGVLPIDPARPDRLRLKDLLGQARDNSIMLNPNVVFLRPQYPDGEFKEKAFLITGVSHEDGFGYETAALAIDHGAKAVGVTFRERSEETERVIEKLRQRTERTRTRVVVIQNDQSDIDQAIELVPLFVAEAGQIDVFIDNAGIIAMGKLVDSTPGDVVNAHVTNIIGPQIIQDAAVRQMITQGNGGRIVNIESMGMLGTPEQRLYVAAKLAKAGVARSGAIEHVRDKISFVGVAPGFAETVMTRGAVPEEQRAGIKKFIGQEELSPVDIAEYILFAASSLAEGYNAQTIPVVRPFQPRQAA